MCAVVHRGPMRESDFLESELQEVMSSLIGAETSVWVLENRRKHTKAPSNLSSPQTKESMLAHWFSGYGVNVLVQIIQRSRFIFLTF